MKTIDGHEMFLSADAEKVAQDLAALGAVFTSGHRDLRGQARAMAQNTVLNRHWIGETYKHGDFAQELVNCHPNWVSEAAIEQGLFEYFHSIVSAEVEQLSHHLRLPCPCMDLQPRFDEVGELIRARILIWQHEDIIKQVLWKEGGLDRWHLEVETLPQIKVSQEV